MNLSKIALGVALVAVIIAGYALVGHSTKTFGSATNCTDGYSCYTNLEVQGNLITDGTAVYNGAVTMASTLVQSGLATFSGGVLYTNTLATTTPASLTLKATDLSGYDTILMTPTVGNITITFPASSTVSTFLPNAGNAQRTCFENSTTTANVYLTFAGGTGFDLEVASSSATALGSTKLGPQKIGCFTFVRGKATPTTFDIHAAYTAFL